MDVHIFILSTMSPRMTNAFFRTVNIDFKILPNIQRFQWQRNNNTGKRVSIWAACQHPLLNDMFQNIFPYMDAAICLYHDHDAMSCLKVRKAVELLSPLQEHIWLMPTNIPKLDRRHESRIKKMYNRDGFVRPLLDGAFHENIESLLEIDLNTAKYLN